MNEVAHTAANEVAPAAMPRSPWSPAVIACVAGIGLAGASLTYAMAVGFSLPYAVALLLLASWCVATVRWKRAGVRNELRSRTTGLVAEFGGGVYGMAAAATWLQMESANLAADVTAAGSLRALVDSISLGWLMQQGMQAIDIAFRAAVWPWHWFSDYGTTAVLLAAGAAWGLDSLIQAVLPRYRAYRETPAVAAD